jgi:BirA family biotin operon repressor/biotin-[acetyl-CoA-carboxylase] ligase
MTIAWPIRELTQALDSVVPGCAVEVVPSIDSTNSELMRRARGGQLAPTLLVAERQTAGRGRLGRVWLSDSANDQSGASATGPAAPLPVLMFSLALTLAPQDWSGLSLAVGVSVAQALHPGLQLKWPNDIWFQDRKLAGILIETARVGEHRVAVIGVGINITPRDPAGLSTAPACLQELLPQCDAPAALMRVAPALLQAVRTFESQGFAAFHAAFARRDVLRERPVRLSDGVCGRAAGVNERGGLLVHTSSGMKIVTSAEVSVRPVGERAGIR